MKIQMNKEIFAVISAVKAHRDFLYCNSLVIGDSETDCYKLNWEYYTGLPLPEGMNKNNHDYKAVISYGLSHEFDEAYRTDSAELGKFNWKNF